jgi:hypothetical protein
MLSTKSSVSAPVVSRKYSAMVSADRATRRRAPGRLVHLAEDHAGLLDDAAAGVADLGSPAFPARGRSLRGSARRRRRTPSNRRGPGDTGDQLGENHRLAQPGTAEQPALPPRTNGVSRSITLMPVSNSSVFVDRSSSGGRIAVDRPIFLGIHRTAAVDRLAQQVEHAAQRRLADGHRHRSARYRCSPARASCRRCCPGRRSERDRRPGAAALRP